MPTPFRRAVTGHAVLVALLLAGRAARAQQAPRGRIEGEVVDSVHARALPGALVMATRLSPEPAQFFNAVADAKGRYRFDTLSAGRFSIAFVAPFLDSLGVVLPAREIVLGEGEHARLDLATPSGADFRARACPGVALPPGRGAVIGEVTDADSEQPIPGARLVVAWSEISFDRGTLRTQTTQHSGGVTADSLGRYRLCGVPSDTHLLVQAQTGKVAGTAIALVVDDSLGFSLLPLSLSTTEAHAAADTASEAGADSLPPPLTGTALLTGTVRSQDGHPLAAAHVRVVDAALGAVTDSLGRFELHGLPAGSQVAEVRKLGYQVGRKQVELRRGRSVAIDVRLTRVVSLDSIRTVAQRTRYRDFEEHRRGAWGRFLDEAEVAKRNAFDTSDLLRMTPGIRIRGSGPDAIVVSTRGAQLMGGPCTLNIVIDHMPHMDINMVRPNEVAAMEIYTSAAGVPAEYSTATFCGAVVIWTKR